MSAAARRAHGMRSRLGGSFDQECSIVTPGAPVANGAGGWMGGPDVVLEGVPCEVRFPKGNAQRPEGQAIETTLKRVEIRLPVGTAISEKARIEVAGRAYVVQGHDAGRSFASEILCDCLREGDGA